MSEDIKIYKPKLVSEHNFELKDNQYNKTLFEGTDDGYIKMDLDKEVAIQRMSKDLYQYASSGLRELYVNEVRACHTAREKYGADPTIIIRYDDVERRIVIEGIDSMGMSAERFKKVFTVLGHSDNFDGNMPGQFGMGRAAYTCLSDNMILNTYSRVTDEKFAVMGVNGLGYKILTKPKIESYGTSINLILYDRVDYSRLRKMMNRMCRFSGVRTILVSDYKGVRDEVTLGPITVQQRIKEKLSRDFTLKNLITFPIHLEDDLISIDGCVVLDNKGSHNEPGCFGMYMFERCGNSIDTYLVGVPIETGNIFIPLEVAILNVKNERKLPPTPDRERFSEKSILEIQERINKLFVAYDGLNISSLQEYHTSDKKPIYWVLSKDVNFNEPVHGNDTANDLRGDKSFMDERSRKLVRLLAITIKKDTGKKLTFHDEYNGQKDVFYMDRWDKSKVAALRKMFENPFIFRAIYPKDIPLCQEFGILSGDEFLQREKIKVTRVTNAVTDCVVHHTKINGAYKTTTVCSNSTRIDFDEILDDDTIRVDREFKMIREILGKIDTSYQLVKNRKEIQGGIFFEDFVKKIQTKTYPTNRGLLTVKQIGEYSKFGDDAHVNLMEYANRNLAKTLHPTRETVHVISTSDDIFEVAVWCAHNGVKYTHNDREKMWAPRTDKKNTGKFAQSSSFEGNLDDVIGEYSFQRNAGRRDGTEFVNSGRVDTVPMLLTILDGMINIGDERVLRMFLETISPVSLLITNWNEDKVGILQKYLADAKSISDDIASKKADQNE